MVFTLNQRQESVERKRKDIKSYGIYHRLVQSCTAKTHRRQQCAAVIIDVELIGRPPKPSFDPPNRYRVIKQGKSVLVVKFNRKNNRGTVLWLRCVPSFSQSPPFGVPTLDYCKLAGFERLSWMLKVVLLTKPSILLAFEDMSCTCWFHFKSLVILTPRSFSQVKGLIGMSTNVYWLMVSMT